MLHVNLVDLQSVHHLRLQDLRGVRVGVSGVGLVITDGVAEDLRYVLHVGVHLFEGVSEGVPETVHDFVTGLCFALISLSTL